MNPEVNQYVKLIFRNGLQVEGHVVSWSDYKSVINYKNEIITIMKTSEDILIIKTILNKTSAEDKAKLIDKISEINVVTAKSVDDIKNLGALRVELAEIEKKDIIEKATSHEVSGIANNVYLEGLDALPSIFKKSSAIKHSESESTRKTFGHLEELQSLFGQKNKSNK